MAKNINKCLSVHVYEKQMRQAGFLFIFFISQKTELAIFFFFYINGAPFLFILSIKIPINVASEKIDEATFFL